MVRIAITENLTNKQRKKTKKQPPPTYTPTHTRMCGHIYSHTSDNHRIDCSNYPQFLQPTQANVTFKYSHHTVFHGSQTFINMKIAKN